MSEVFLVAFQGRFHLPIVARISLQYFILRNQQMWSSTFVDEW